MKDFEKYKHVIAWGRMIGSSESHIQERVKFAAKTNAPENAIYFADQKWHVYSDINNWETKLMIDRQLERL